jgi:ABC-type Na+ efflux pump permease subunit
MRYSSLILAASLVAAPVGVLVSRAAASPAKPAAKAAKYDEGKLKALEAKLAKNAKDAKLKMEVAEANYQVGHTMMVNPDLPPRVKYPGALKKFRRALALNPKHAKAAQEKKMIEDIYKQMGRPVPG